MLRPYLTRQVPDATTEREPAHAGRRDDSRGHGQAEWVSGMIDVAPERSATNQDRLLLRIDTDVPHRRQIDHQAVVADAKADGVVAAAANRHDQLLLAREVHCGLHVCDVGAFRDQPGPAIDHSVVDLACLVVLRIARRDELAAQRTLESNNRGVTQHVYSDYSMALKTRSSSGLPVIG